ncbi:MAG: M28 family peptidase [Deltaproteobacteria bacterium]|uniref:M28 family peptidase n=1 Tax=Candidatus Zymogenus saltonus TaxID=2844893 RepID=A0A9D8KH09_9DELT|nr:M28 family peptidase [Candidatus Zymogenus saltonus]
MKFRHIIKTLVIFLFAAAVFAVPICGQEAEHLSAIWEEFTDIPRSRGDRCTDIVGIFKRLGANEIHVERIEGGNGCPGNIIVPIDSNREDGGGAGGCIIVSSHLDMKGEGVGALDNYSGVLMMAALYKEIKGCELKHDFLFIAFDREEEGLLGSKAFVKGSRYKPGKIHAVINFDCLGITLPHPWPEGSSDSLEELFVDVGEKFGHDLSPVSISYVRTDSVPFLKAGIPAITLDGIMPYDVFILDSKFDDPSVVDRNVFFQSYNILLEYILEVDSLLESPDAKSVK